jgi:hypothetical protein
MGREIPEMHGIGLQLRTAGGRPVKRRGGQETYLLVTAVFTDSSERKSPEVRLHFADVVSLYIWHTVLWRTGVVQVTRQ